MVTSRCSRCAPCWCGSRAGASPGTNLFNILLLFAVDLAYRGGPALEEVGRFSLVASLLGALLAAIFLVGLIERRDRTVLRMGVDSFAVLACYLGGLVVLYQLR